MLDYTYVMCKISGLILQSAKKHKKGGYNGYKDSPLVSLQKVSAGNPRENISSFSFGFAKRHPISS